MLHVLTMGNSSTTYLPTYLPITKNDFTPTPPSEKYISNLYTFVLVHKWLVLNASKPMQQCANGLYSNLTEERTKIQNYFPKSNPTLNTVGLNFICKLTNTFDSGLWLV